MTVADQVKILGRKIMKMNQAAKIYAYSSNDLDKYEYLSCEI